MDSDRPSAVPGGWTWPDDVAGQARAAQPRHEPNTGSTSYQAGGASSTRQRHQYSTSGTSEQSSSGQQQRKHWKPRQCRICLDEVQPTFQTPMEHVPGIFQPAPQVIYEDENGRLLRPCKCRGSQKWVHRRCLEMWRHSDRTNRGENFYQCPTCKYKYQLSRLGWSSVISSVGKF